MPLNENFIKLQALCDICASALSENYNLVCQFAHRCRLNKQSVSLYRGGRGRVIAYEPSLEVTGGAGTHTHTHWSAFASPLLARTSLLFLPTEAVGTLLRLSAVRSMCLGEKKKSGGNANSVNVLLRSWYTC